MTVPKSKIKNPILLQDLIAFGIILRAERAPVEKRFFRNDNDKIVPFEVRPKYVLSKRESRERLNSLTYQLLHSVPPDVAKETKLLADNLSDDIFMYKCYIVISIFQRYIEKDILREYLPSLFNDHHLIKKA